uniref:ATP synthase FO subunit 8 n=1 Tax=Paphnutius ruficeps TaxID=1035836 RepID=M9MTF1_9HEMI|nr:ATP synthase F0 subunit 8 [Paphnutius ruficeps]AEG64525.1 ATP synthase FO subunit 8 [Paphnutius ruficeps]
MPQMAPMWWTSLFLVFISSYLIINAIIYFNYNCGAKYVLIVKYTNLCWKW